MNLIHDTGDTYDEVLLMALNVQVGSIVTSRLITIYQKIQKIRLEA